MKKILVIVLFIIIAIVLFIAYNEISFYQKFKDYRNSINIENDENLNYKALIHDIIGIRENSSSYMHNTNTVNVFAKRYEGEITEHNLGDHYGVFIGDGYMIVESQFGRKFDFYVNDNLIYEAIPNSGMTTYLSTTSPNGWYFNGMDFYYYSLVLIIGVCIYFCINNLVLKK